MKSNEPIENIIKNMLDYMMTNGLTANQLHYLLVMSQESLLEDYWKATDANLFNQKELFKLGGFTVSPQFTTSNFTQTGVYDYQLRDDTKQELLKSVFNIEWNTSKTVKTFDLEDFAMNQGQELYKTYPNSCVIDGNDITLKSVKDFKYKNKDYKHKHDLLLVYGKILGFEKSPKKAIEKHNEIIEKVNFAINNQLGIIKQSITNFILNEAWEEIDTNNSFYETL